MKHVADYVDAGTPIIGMRTATHAFRIKGGKAYAKYSFNRGFPGSGFVLGCNRASFDRINKGSPQDQGQQNRRIQWVKAARMPFA